MHDIFSTILLRIYFGWILIPWKTWRFCLFLVWKQARKVLIMGWKLFYSVTPVLTLFFLSSWKHIHSFPFVSILDSRSAPGSLSNLHLYFLYVLHTLSLCPNKDTYNEFLPSMMPRLDLHRDGSKHSEHKLELQKFRSDIRKSFFARLITEAGFSESLRNVHPWRCLKLDWTSPEQSGLVLNRGITLILWTSE